MSVLLMIMTIVGKRGIFRVDEDLLVKVHMHARTMRGTHPMRITATRQVPTSESASR